MRKHLCVHVYKHVCAEYTRSCGRVRGEIHIHTYAYVSYIRVCMYESILGLVAEGGEMCLSRTTTSTLGGTTTQTFESVCGGVNEDIYACSYVCTSIMYVRVFMYAGICMQV